MSRARAHADWLNRPGAIVLSCEHAGHAVPKGYRDLFAATPAVLTTHRGYDIGIAPVAARIGRILEVPLWVCRTSRLLIEPNRSLHHPKLFSQFSRGLPVTDKSWLVEHVWRPHREAVTKAVADHVRRDRQVLHLALHSFTPVLEGEERTAEIGLLYDPQRSAERGFALDLRDRLRAITGLRVRRNYPYRGCADGLTTALRRVFSPKEYLGLEIEWNQGLLTGSEACRRRMAELFCDAVREAWQP
jgi:predicted N-formylglutamate amidohydrolase